MMKAILLDIDGTLTNDKKEITPETKRVLMKAQEQGIRLVIASGRPAKGIEQYGKMLEMDKHHGLFLCFNGAKVIDCQTGEVLVNTTMERSTDICKLFKRITIIWFTVIYITFGCV